MIESFFPIILFAIIATISPGGATTLATASGAQFGFVRSLPLMLGMVSGLATLVASAAIGLAALLLAVPVLSLLVKICGSLYLLWLAYKVAHSGAPQKNGPRDTPTGFIAGYLLLLINPKGWAMAFGASASFSTLASNPVELALIMGIIFAGVATTSLSLWCAGGTLLARILKTEFQWQVLNTLLALLLVVAILQLWVV